MLTQEELKREVRYDPNTGIFTRISSKMGPTLGRITMRPRTAGHFRFWICGKERSATQMAWLYMTGELVEPRWLYHRSGDTRDCRWGNIAKLPPITKNSLTKEILQQYLRYVPETGEFFYVAPPLKHPELVGKRAGTWKSKSGYRQIGIAGTVYLEHRLAWFWVHGEWPQNEIDHINGNPADNRFVNLRVATRSQNNANRKRIINRSGFRGVTALKKDGKHTGRWMAAIKHKHKTMYLGSFDTPEAASAAYKAAAAFCHGDFAYKAEGI